MDSFDDPCCPELVTTRFDHITAIRNLPVPQAGSHPKRSWLVSFRHSLAGPCCVVSMVGTMRTPSVAVILAICLCRRRIGEQLKHAALLGTIRRDVGLRQLL